MDDDDGHDPLDLPIQEQRHKRKKPPAPPRAPSKPLRPPAVHREPSGWDKAKAKKEAAAADAARERERSGANADLDARITAICEEPSDALGNQRFANNVARALAEALLRDRSIPLELKCKLVGDQIDRIAATHSKALNAERIERLQTAAGVKGKAKPDATRVVPVGAGSALRAGGRIQRGKPVHGHMPELSSEDDGRGVASGGGPVGLPPDDVH